MTATGVIASGRTAIPVRNLWLLMTYASQLYQRDDIFRERGIESNPEDLINVVGEILAAAVERRLRRSLGRMYRARSATLSRVRGRIDQLQTESGQLLLQGKVACTFSELSVDNPRNRLIRSALVVAARMVTDAQLEQRCRRLAETYSQYGVSPALMTSRDAASVTLGRNDTDDLETVDAARLILQFQIPAEQADNRTGRDPEREAEVVRRLYEQAVRGFYRATLSPPWRVSPGERMHRWPLSSSSVGLPTYLPIMKTDTMIESPDRRIIVETKFVDALKPGQYGARRFSRNHIFQIYAYVQSQHDVDDLARAAEGILLYPAVGETVDESAVIQGHHYRFLTVDLAASAMFIRESLLRVVEPATNRDGRST